VSHRNERPVTRFELGISSWSLPWSIGVPGYPQPATPLDAVGLVERAARAGVSVVQIADNLPLHEASDTALDALADAARAASVRLEVGTRSLDPAHVSRYVEVARRVDARILRTVLSGRLCGPTEITAAEAGIAQVLGDLDRHGVTLAIENNEALSAAELAGLIMRADSPRVRACLDTANSLGRPEVVETVLEHLGPYAVVLHAKDFEVKRVPTRMGFSVVGCPVGDGQVDFGRVLTELAARGSAEISVIVEHWPPFEGDIESTRRYEEKWLDRSLGSLQRMLAQQQ
jgi:sugar phosphate isomerase/epimerase